MVATTVPALTDGPTGEAARPSSERFDVGPLLGRGGMGEVRLARDLRVDRDVAIKLLRGTAGPEAVSRFLREARVQARLDHPSIVPVYDLGVDEGGVPYFAMKRLTGQTLHEVLAAPHPVIAQRVLLARFVEVCLAIEFAHTRGVIHRDLKPSNIMLGDFGEVYVLDWGIASIAGERGSDPDLSAAITATGALVGTAGYMAPEQIRGEPVEPRTDVFALGLLLYEILAGVPALPAGTAAYEPTLTTRCHRPSAVCEVPPELDATCARATAVRAGDRYPTARALADAIQAYLDGDRDHARRHELAAAHATAATVALRAGAGEAAMREVGCALALVPTERAALDVARRLLFEQPLEIPPEVHARIEGDRRRATHLQLGTAMKAYACMLALLPLALLTHLNTVAPIAVLAAILAGATLGTIYVRRHPHLVRRWLDLALVLHGAMIVTVGAVTGPFQIVPIAGVISLALFLGHPALRRPHLVIAAHMGFVILPLALELLHVTPSTFAFDGGTLTVALSTVELGPIQALVAITGTVWLLQLVIALIVVRQRRAQDRARQQLHLYSWRLGHLLPSDAASTPSV